MEYSLFFQSEIKLINFIESINGYIKEINKDFDLYKKNLTIESIDTKIQELEKKFNENYLIYIRADSNDKILEIQNIDKMLRKLKIKSKEIRDEIDLKQKDFLSKYFAEIQNIYKSLGSYGYRIEKEDVSRGKKKVFGLNLFFNNIKVNETRFVLSESDRRALALSVFLAKIKVDKNPYAIIVLDDPITSFDEERMRNFGLIIDELKDNCYQQMIMMLHYENYFKKATKIFKERKLMKIECDMTTHYFKELSEEDELLKSSYEKLLNSIIDFITRKVNNFSENTARIFFEKYLHYQFCYEHVKDNLYGSDMNEFIVNLKKRGLINQEQENNLMYYKRELNESSHNYANFSEEEKRNFIREFYEYLVKIK